MKKKYKTGSVALFCVLVKQHQLSLEGAFFSNKFQFCPPIDMELKSVLGIFLIVVLASEPSFGISRSTVISNADSWLNPAVPYSQSRTKDGYRTDCSGFVSMAWELPTSRTTRTLGAITTAISKDSLKSGDILLKSGSHVTIFDSWVDSNKDKYWGYEQVGGRINKTKYWRIPYPYWGNDSGYQPRRYDDITD